MGKLLKRLSVLMLCVALVVSDNAVSGFAAQLQENPEVISEVTDEAVVIEEEITDEKDVEDEDILELETEIDSENEGIFADEEVVDSNDTIESETAAIEESAVEGTEEEIVATEEVVTTEALNDATYTFKYSVNEDGKTVTITGLEGTASGDLVIPDTIEEYPVTSIGSYAFSACSGFTGDLVIPDSVTSIGVYSFLNCTGFKGNLTIGKNVESIGGHAFCGCKGFKGDLIIPDSVTNIGDQAFFACEGFTGNLTISNSVKIIGNGAFDSCFGFTGDLVIPDSVEKVGTTAFSYCEGFTGLTIGNSVKDIGDQAFMMCSGFTGDLLIPDSVESIGSEAFENCTGFTGKLTIPQSVKTMSDIAFEGCSGLCVVINDSENEVSLDNTHTWYNADTNDIITSIANGKALIGDDKGPYDEGKTYRIKYEINEEQASVTITGLEGTASGDLVIPDTIEGYPVTSIGDNAFKNCSGFKGSLTVGNNVESIGGEAFYNCSFTGSLVIPNSVTSIGVDAFTGCCNLKSIMLPCIFQNSNDLGLDDVEDKVFVHNSPQGKEACTQVLYSGNCGDLNQANNTRGNNATYELLCNGTLNISGTGNIGEGAFIIEAMQHQIKSVVIGSGITGIYDDAFNGCSNLSSIEIPTSVTSIGQFTFVNCSSLSSIEIPTSVTSIDRGAFSGCSSLSSIEIPNSVTSISDDTFYNCRNLGSVNIPNSVTSIGENVFAGCSNLSSITMPCRFNERDDLGLESSVEKKLVHEKTQGSEECARVVDSGNCGSFDVEEEIFGDDATYVLKCDRTLTIRGNGSIGSGFFANNNLIENVVINSGINTICNGAFKKCENIKSVSIPDTVYSIGDEAFSGCAKIENIEIPNSIRSIGSYAFNNCTSLTSITIPDSVKDIDEGAFIGCSGLRVVINNSEIEVPLDENHTWYNAETNEQITSIKNGKALIGDDKGPYDEGKTYRIKYEVNDGQGSVTITGIEGEYTGNLTIPDTIDGYPVTRIGDSAFYNCDGFTGNLTIPDGITSIGEYAFYNCSGFTGSLTIPDSITSIGDSAFRFCDGFTGNLIIPDSVTSIGNYAFYNCCGFTGSLTISDRVTSIGDHAFGDCYGFTGDLVIPDGVTSIGDFVFLNCSGFTGDLVIPDSVTSIGIYAFSGCSGFTGDLVIPDSVTKIGDGVFSGCSGFTGDLVIPDSVTRIGDSAFYNCYGFTGNLTIPDGITSIGEYAFCNCSGFTGSLTIPDSITSIASSAFRLCGGFTGNLIIPDSVTRIGNSAFAGCSGFTGDLVIPDSVTRIGNSAFAGCSGFDGYLIKSGSVVIPENAFDGCNFIDTIVGFFWIRPIANQTYTGKAISPNVEVYHGGEKLVLNKDYSLRITKNINIGEALVTVTGKGNYTGVETANFNIVAADISSDAFTADDFVLKSNGRDQKPKPVLKWNGKVVAANTYAYQYFAANVNEDGTLAPTGEALTALKEAGKYVIVLTAKDGGNFIGTRNVKVTLTGSAQTLVSSLAITAIKPQTYTGAAIEPAVTVKSGRTELTRSEDGVTGDYTVEYKNNTAVGTATVTIKGLGDYVGTKTTTFKITGTPITKATVEGITAMTYTGNPIRFSNLKLYIKATKTTSQIDLKRGIDYTVAYTNNLKAGTATVTFTGINGYTGTVKKTFKISAVKYADATGRFTCEFVDSQIDENGIVYSKGGAKPAVTVKFTNADKSKITLNEKTDYTVAYSNNTAVNDWSNPKKIPTVKITLKGSYSGTITKTFKITAKDIGTKVDDKYVLKAEAADKTFSNKPGAYKSAVKLTDTDGKALGANKDYLAAVKYSVIRDGLEVVLGPKDIVNAGEEVTITVTAKENSNYTGEITTKYRVTTAAISSAKVVQIEPQIYTGEAITLTQDDIIIKPKALEDALVYGTDYEIVEGSYTNNINKGTASVIIKGLNNYGGTRKVTFTIKTKTILWWNR